MSGRGRCCGALAVAVPDRVQRESTRQNTASQRQSRRSPASTRSSASTTTSSTPASTRPTRSCRARAGPRRSKPATSSTRPPPGGGSCSIPRAAPSTASCPRPVETRHRLHGSVDGARAGRTPRRSSIVGARLRDRASSGACCATKSSPPRATASASSWRSSAPSRSIRIWTMPISASGCIRYYADVAPAAAKVLRFLLLLPGGNKTEGLAQMLRARTRGRLLQGEAEYQLQIIYLWYEHRTDEAVGDPRVAARPLSRQSALPQRARRRAGHAISTTSRRASTPGARCWRWRASSDVNEAALAEARARLGVARQLDALCQTDHAIEQLHAVVESKPARPLGALAAAYLAPRRGRGSSRQPRRGGRRLPRRRSNAAPSPDSAGHPPARRANGMQTRAGRDAGPRRIASRSTASASSRSRTSRAPSRARRAASALDADDPRRALSLRPRRSRRRRTTPRRSAQFESGDPRRARLPAADRGRRVPRSGASARAARAPRRRRSTTTAPRARCSAAAPTRAPRRIARCSAFARAK